MSSIGTSQWKVKLIWTTPQHALEPYAAFTSKRAQLLETQLRQAVDSLTDVHVRVIAAMYSE